MSEPINWGAALIAMVLAGAITLVVAVLLDGEM